MNPEDNHLLETIKSVLVPIHPAGLPFIAAFAGVGLLLTLASSGFFWPCLILTAWCTYFFRDPARVVPQKEGLVVSPGDGVVQKIVRVVPPAELGLGDTEYTRISIFLNVFNVHVNRIPIGGTIARAHYVAGKFLNASLDKASEENERQMLTITTEQGANVGVVQIAGLVARRILCDAKQGHDYRTGERFGLIRFGSRVDVFLPPRVAPLVVVGQIAIGGETILADLNGTETARLGVLR